MRVLYLSQGRKAEDHPGYHDAMQRLSREGVTSFYHNLPYIGFAEEHGFDALWAEIIRQARAYEVDSVYFQYFHRKANESPLRCIEALRALPSRPTIAVSCGDAYSANWMWPHFPESFKICALLSDIVFSTHMGRTADLMIKWGAKNIVLLPHALCQIRFQAHANLVIEADKEFDVVWVGSRRVPKPNVWNRVFWNGRRRVSVVSALSKRYGARFGLFGHQWDGWPSWQGPVPFCEQQNTFRRGRLVVDALPDPFGDHYYASDRPFFELASGTPVILFEKPGLDRLFKRGVHAHFVSTVDGLLNTCDRLSAIDPQVLQTQAAQAAAWIAARHTQYERMKFAMETVKLFRGAKIHNRKAAAPCPPYFLPEVDLEREMQYAVRGWVGE